MEYNLEKNIKRFLKRKIKITLGFIVAFLLSCSFVSAVDYELEVTIDENEKILFNGEIFNPETHEFIENTFENNLYTNKDIISGVKISENKNIGKKVSISLSNIGSIINNNYHGIHNDKQIIEELNNIGMISSKYHGIQNFNGTINTFKNSGIISSYTYGIFISGIVDILSNRGTILSTFGGSSSAISFDEGIINTLSNTGIIYTNSQSSAISIGDLFGDEECKVLNFNNAGVINNRKNHGIYIYGNAKLENFTNTGVISGGEKGIQISSGGIIANLNNYGIIGGNSEDILNDGTITNQKNYGLLINGKTIKAGDGGVYEEKEIINGVEFSGDNAVAKVVKSSELTKKDKLIINVVGDTNTAFNIDENLKISNSIINGYKNAIVLNNGAFEGNNITVTAGEKAFVGSNNEDSLTLTETSIINGNTLLGGGNDSLSLDNTVQINGILDGGDGLEDKLTFTSNSTTGNTTDNLNILYEIKNFEKTSISSDVTIFENTIDSNLEIQNLNVQLGDITIEKNGNLVLRVDGTKKDTDEKVTGHALYENTGSITAENGGKLTLNAIGFGESEVVDFKNTDLSNLKNEDVKLSSALHKGKINTDDNTIIVEAKTDIDNPEFENMSKYENLKKIHLSIINSGNLKEFNVFDEQLGAYLKYRHDIYAGNPYAYSSELSRKTMGIMRNLADKDLKPELNKWAVYGGFTHVDGGTENSYYGKGYYTYDIGSRDIKADTKITGGYFKAEFGKSQDITTGIIFGGNNSETEIGASKVEGDSFYFGAYAKKYLNNFRFTLGAGFQHGDYKGDRTAIGYEGITETRKYDSNYHDRGFDIYGNIKYSKEIGNNFFFEPSFTLSYTYLDQDGAEDEEGALAAETDSQNFDYSSGEINLDLRKTFAGEKFTHSFTGGVSYERMLSGYDEEYITGRIKGGTDFDILVPEKEKDIFSLNAKYELETDKGILFDVKGSYRFEHDTDQNEWTVGTGIGYKF